MRLRLFRPQKVLPTQIQASTVAWVNGPNPLGPVVDGMLGHVCRGFDGGNVPREWRLEKKGRGDGKA